MKVLVAGAGFAGLHAAWLLRRDGHEVIVCEARSRVGGRVWSHRLQGGACIERGAEFIFPGEYAILGLCATLRLPLIPHGLSFYRREVNGQPAPSLHHLEEVQKKLAEALAQESSNANESPPSVLEIFERALGRECLSDPVLLRKATSMTVDPSLASGPAELPREAAMTGYLDHSYHVVGGNQRIAQAMAHELGRAVRLECPIDAVMQSERGVEFITSDGTSLSGDGAIVAIPFPILTRLHLDFPLPSLVEEALSILLMGAAIKVSVPLAELASMRAVQSADRWWAWNSVDPGSQHSAASVTTFASRSPDVERVPCPGAEDAWPQELSRLRPDLALTGDPLVTDWAREQWTEGSYTSHGLNWQTCHDHAFDGPVGRIAFAGEHTSPAAVRGMEGALRTGRRAALSLEAALA